MMHHYHDICADSFEKLIVKICKEILGEGVQGFTKGVDGGKDGVFIGTANLYPSKTSPWQGNTIIQAKHTTGINKDFLESDFYSENSKSSILAEECEKINKLIENNELDNYMLFANRKLTPHAASTIKQYICRATNLSIENIAVLGIDDLDNWMERYPYIVTAVNLTPLTIAPTIRPDDLALVIEEFSSSFNSSLKHTNFNPVKRTDLPRKNQLNNMSESFAKALRRNYMSYMQQVDLFLKDAQNSVILELYQSAIEEFQLKFICPKISIDDVLFDTIFNELIDLLVNRSYTLRTNTRLTRILVFYMYWDCDIGISDDD